MPLTIINGGHSLDIPVDNDTVGFMHTHLDNFIDGIDKNGDDILKKPIHMFSPADIIMFLKIAKNTSTNGVPLHLAYGTMISSTGTYTMRFTGNTDNIVNVPSALELKESYKKYFKINFRGNEEKAFLNFIQDFIKIDGISLYRIRDNGDIEKKTLMANGGVDSNDCN